MSYQVLARKWRPQNFEQMVGQEHVLKALANALDQDRLHHAYLFSGTRGVGKTTVARIFAKSLNCETGVTSKPCGECTACTELVEGRFVDLIEIDAASRTKVDDMRELLENAQYAPTRSRYKIYLIDEVHMLSNSSFNALLKTLEEPPPHIKFLLATTDPQKLPVTVLSRCLQFNLKNLSPERIANYLKSVLEAEAIEAETPALWEIARAADGSMRDALSLTDQCIAFGNGVIATKEVLEMLGTIDRHLVIELLQSLAAGNGPQVLDHVQRISGFSPDFSSILDSMADFLHRVAIEQLVPNTIDDSLADKSHVTALARQMSAEDTQLFYEIALLTRRDLMLAPDPRTGFEMGLLRMLAFRPNAESLKQLGGKSTGNDDVDEEGEPHRHQQDRAVQQNPERVSIDFAAKQPESEQAGRPDSSKHIAGNHSHDAEKKSLENADSVEPLDSAYALAPTLADTSSNEEQDEVNSPEMHSLPLQDDSGFYQTPSENQLSAKLSNAQRQPSAQAHGFPFVDEQVVMAPGQVDFDNEYVKQTVEQEEQKQKNSVISVNGLKQEFASGDNTHPTLDSFETASADDEDDAEDSEELLPLDQSDLEYTPGNNLIVKSGAGEPRLLRQRWADVVGKLNIRGLTYNLAQRCVLQNVLGERLEFVIDEEHFDFFNQLQHNRLTDALSEYMGTTVRIAVTPGTSDWLSPLQELEAHRAELQSVAEQEINSDPNIREIIEHFDAHLIENSIEPVVKTE